jgi:hypothetical protein
VVVIVVAVVVVVVDVDVVVVVAVVEPSVALFDVVVSVVTGSTVGLLEAPSEVEPSVPSGAPSSPRHAEVATNATAVPLAQPHTLGRVSSRAAGRSRFRRR